MKYGAKNAENTSIRYDQKNNVAETMLADLKSVKMVNFWLESCNVESCACGVEAVGAKWLHEIPKTKDGKAMFGQGDLMFSLLFSPYGQKNAPSVKMGVMENEVADNLVWAIKENSTAFARIVACNPATVCDLMRSALKLGHAVVVSYLTDYRSGHYICVVQYDTDKNIFRCYDSWADNKHCKKNGVLEEYDDKFFSNRARERFIEISAT